MEVKTFYLVRADRDELKWAAVGMSMVLSKDIITPV